MQVIGNIKIFTEEEIIKKGIDRDDFLKNNVSIIKKRIDRDDFLKNNVSCQDLYNTEYIKRLLKEPMPYKLFRLNELFSHTLNGIGCEITEEQYMDRLEQLPPKAFKNYLFSGYLVNECITDDIYEHIFNYENKYYCVIMSISFKVA